jgi:diguanylate cyclase (GGDEF)-like protein
MLPAIATSETPGRPRDPVSRRWNLAFNLITIGFCLICALFSLDVRRSAWEQARLSAANLATAIRSDIERNVELYDLSLQAVVDNFRKPGLDALSPEFRHLVLFDRAATAQYLGSILVLDPRGAVILDSRALDAAPRNYADRDFFAAHLGNSGSDTGLGLYVSAPEVDARGDRVIGISRRLTRADGSFAGVVVGMLRLAYFDDLFRKLNPGPGSTIALVRADGTMLARRPMEGDSVGRNIAATALFRHFGPTARSGTFSAKVGHDGVDRFFTYTQIGDLPLVLSVGLSSAEIDAAWLRDSVILGLVAALLMIAAAVLKQRLRAELARRVAAEEALARQARTDSLTGLPNRRHFDETLAREWRRALRAGTPLGLLMIDADHFKSYNDRFGHQAGDELLAALAQVIAGTTQRASDFAARYGGEEFVVLLAGPDAHDGEKLAERICRGVAAMIETPSAGILDRMTVSIGVACIVPDARAIHQDLLGAADRALFAAKQGGRNRVAAAAPIVAAKPRLVA